MFAADSAGFRWVTNFYFTTFNSTKTGFKILLKLKVLCI
jgi:hypothetical protein